MFAKTQQQTVRGSRVAGVFCQGFLEHWHRPFVTGFPQPTGCRKAQRPVFLRESTAPQLAITILAVDDLTALFGIRLVVQAG